MVRYIVSDLQSKPELQSIGICKASRQKGEQSSNIPGGACRPRPNRFSHTNSAKRKDVVIY